jgi:hypothetical protein
VKLLGVVLDRKLNFKAHIEGVANKAERTLRALRVLGGTIRGVRGSALRLMYLACVRTVMEYGCEVWLSGDVGQIKKLESIQYEALKRVVGAYKGTAADVLEKEAAVPPLRIRLEHVLELKLTRILFRVDHENPVFERMKERKIFGKKRKDRKNEKNEKRKKIKKRPNFDETRNNYLANLPQEESLADLPVLVKISPWNEGTPDGNSEATAAEHWKALRARQRQNQVNLQAKWQERYQVFLTARAGRWYKEITKEDGTSPTTNMSKLITTEVFKNYPREILSRITQFRTGNGDIGAYLQKRKVPKDNYNCKCGEFETVQHIVKHCQRTVLKRGILFGVSPDLDLAQLLNTPKGLQAMKEYLS